MVLSVFISHLMGLMCSNCMVPFGKLDAIWLGGAILKIIVIFIMMDSISEVEVVKSFDTKLSLFLEK